LKIADSTLYVFILIFAFNDNVNGAGFCHVDS
jgi:hypothetical protein